MEFLFESFCYGRRIKRFAFFSFLFILFSNNLIAQCCTDNTIDDGSLEASVTVDEKFPDAVTTTSNNAKTDNLPQWFYDDGTNDSVTPTAIYDPTRASDGNQFGYIPKPAMASVYNNCIGNNMYYASPYSCQADYYTTGVRYIASFDYIPFNKDVPAGGTGAITPIMEFQSPGSFITLDIYDGSGNLLNSDETAVAWAAVATSWKTAYALIPSVSTTGTNILWFSHHKDGTCGMLFDNAKLMIIELQSHGLDDVTAGSDNTEIDFTLNPTSNVVGVTGVYYEVVPPSGYTITPTLGAYNQETSFTLSIDAGNMETGSGSTITVEVRDQVNTDCSVTATMNNPHSLDVDGDNVDVITDLDDDNDGIPDTRELCGTDPVPIVTTTPIDVTINLDYYPRETSWNLTGPSGIVASGGPYSNGYRNLTLTGALDVTENGSYSFTIFDSYPDGMSGNEYAAEGVDFAKITNTFDDGASSSINFTVSSINDNIFSCLAGDPLGDSDDDDILNYKDTDFCTLNSAGVCESMDADGDGIINSLDIDSDNDGITDIVENAAGDVSVDNGGSGVLDGRVNNFTDTDTDGWNDASASSTTDTDGDNIPNYLDIDSDNDGISDYVEGVCTSCPTATGPSGGDLDGDGLLDIFETMSSDNADNLTGTNQGVTPNVDSDDFSDSFADFLDTDSDGDNSYDWNEGFDLNGDGSALDDLITIAANYEAALPAPGHYTTTDTDTDGIPDWADNLSSSGYTEGSPPPFLNASNAAWVDSNNDGLVALFDAAENGTSAPTPDNNGSNDDDWRDANSLVALPVDLIYFSVKEKNCKALIEWTTEQEIDLDYFEIEYSRNGVDFELLSRIPAIGGSGRQYYTYENKNPDPWNLYRLKMVDLDGSFDNGDWAILELSCSEIEIYPNPIYLSEGSFVVSFKDGTIPLSIDIYNELGSLITSVSTSGMLDRNLEINLRRFSTGVYYLKIGSDNFEKIVILD